MQQAYCNAAAVATLVGRVPRLQMHIGPPKRPGTAWPTCSLDKAIKQAYSCL